MTFIGCIDIDECDTQGHDCHVKAKCTDSEGSFDCACFAGYSGNGFHCSGK